MAPMFVFYQQAAPLSLLKQPHTGWCGAVRSIDILYGVDGAVTPLSLAALASSPQGEPWYGALTGGDTELSADDSWRTVHEMGSSTLLAAFFAYFLGGARK